MTIGKLRAKIRKLHEEHEEEEIEGGELNLVPYLDIVTNVIMFLLATTTFAAALSNINVTLPSIGAGGDEGPSEQQARQDLNLTIQISDRGFTIAASGAVLYDNDVPGRVPTIPKKENNYNFFALTQKIRLIKDSYRDETKAIINADPNIRYEVLVGVMDALRQDAKGSMFPDVLLSAGVN